MACCAERSVVSVSASRPETAVLPDRPRWTCWPMLTCRVPITAPRSWFTTATGRPCRWPRGLTTDPT